MIFVVRNKHLYKTNQEIHGLNTRHNTDLHFSTVKLTIHKEGTYATGMRIFNHLPINIKLLSYKIELFKPALFKVILFIRGVF